MSRKPGEEQVAKVEGVEGNGHIQSEPKEKFWRVRFAAKSRPEDEDDVTLSVNGKALVLEREKDIVLPERYVDAARHAQYPQFRQLPNHPRKIVGKVNVFPFELKGEATEAEYLKMFEDGTRKTQAAIAQE